MTTTTVNFNKEFTILKDLKGGRTRVTSHKYRELERVLAGETEITANYYYGQARRREAQLQALGFARKETIWRNESVPHDPIREVWSREAGA
ncbi:hypothetical protein J2T17_007469 [Paenibacillus mucilaginosus]|uniref:hypothetical protein n=1 Tax=Paenibacillus mucilaginosus TaxID=61624 RepID=UPI003D1A763F